MSEHTIYCKYQEFTLPQQLTKDEQELITLAWQARANAYAPYSQFFVGASARTKDGSTFLGSNQENANFKASCAERVLLDSIGAAGKKDMVEKIAVVGGNQNLDLQSTSQEKIEPVTPCGQCRQDIKEVESLSKQAIIIILASPTLIRRFVGISALLPFAFGPADLTHNNEK